MVDGDHPGQPTYDASSSDAPPYVSDDQQSAGSAPYDSPHQPYMYNNEDPSSVDDLSMATSHVDDSQAAATPVYGGDGQTETTISAEDSHHTAPYDNNSEAEAITFAYDNISQHTPPYEEDHQAAAMTGYGEDIQAVATTTDFYHDTVEAVSCAYGEGCSLATTSYEDNREAAATSVYINEGYHPDGGEPQAQATTTYAYESEDQTVATALADNTQAATITHEYIGEHQAVATSTYVGESQATSVTNDYDSASEADATTVSASGPTIPPQTEISVQVITYEHSSSVTAANECAATAPPTMEQMQSAMGSWDQTQYAQMHSYIQSAMAAHNGGFGY